MNGLQSVIINVIKLIIKICTKFNEFFLSFNSKLFRQKLKSPEVYIRIFEQIMFSKKNCIMNTMMSTIDGFHMTTGLTKGLLKVFNILLCLTINSFIFQIKMFS